MRRLGAAAAAGPEAGSEIAEGAAAGGTGGALHPADERRPRASHSGHFGPPERAGASANPAVSDGALRGPGEVPSA